MNCVLIYVFYRKNNTEWTWLRTSHLDHHLLNQELQLNLWKNIGTNIPDPHIRECYNRIYINPFMGLHQAAYLSELIKPYAPESNLWSGMKNRLIEPWARLVIFGSRAFYNTGLTLWNKMPTHITLSPTLSSFKQNRKTYLFKHAYDF